MITYNIDVILCDMMMLCVFSFGFTVGMWVQEYITQAGGAWKAFKQWRRREREN